ncbi:MAG: A/G-specific adenine glycosylase [Chthoniobacterales bacterium]
MDKKRAVATKTTKTAQTAVQTEQLAKAARRALISWHARAGRHDLPWRCNNTPYAVLVSEFMLQQTTVATVIPRFADWMKRFPSLPALAAASEQEVLSAWEGLGYYSRARRLHSAAKTIMERHGGSVPDSEEPLLALPGIGAYTAAAILAFAHDRSAVVLDTNIIRVLARWGNVTEPIDTAAGKKAIAHLAGSFFPKTGCREIASALMDLGAMVCSAGKPDCNDCPLKSTCSATAPETLPKKSPRRVTTRLTEHRAWFQRRQKLHLRQSEGPRWRGLWILPELGTTTPSGRWITELTYPITRYSITMKVFPVKGALPGNLRGFTRAELSGLPIPSPHRKAIEKAFRAIAEK